MGILASLKKKAVKSAKGAVGLNKNQKVKTSIKKGTKKAIKNLLKP